jgi:hypothetical protein
MSALGVTSLFLLGSYLACHDFVTLNSAFPLNETS